MTTEGRRTLALALGLAGAFAWVALGPLTPALEGSSDGERDLLRALRLVHGQWPESGPRIGDLDGHLQPGYALLIAPVLWLSPTPLAVHALHVLVVSAGLAALFIALASRVGRPAAWLAVLTLAFGALVQQSLVVVWHNSLVPGLVCLWFATAARALTPGAPRALATLAALTLVLLTTHALAIGFVPPLVAIVFWSRRRVPHAAFVIAAVLTLAALVESGRIALVLLQASASSGPGGLMAALTRGLPLLGLMYAPTATGVVALAILASAGSAVVALARRRFGPLQPFALLTLGTVLLQLALTLLAARQVPHLRYYATAVPGLLVLGALGLGTMAARVPERVSVWAAVIVTVGVVATLPRSWAGRLSPDRQDDPALTLIEQVAVVDHLVARWSLEPASIERVHGVLHGPHGLARFLGASRGTPATATSEVTVLTPNLPRPAQAQRVEVLDVPGGRRLTLVRHAPRPPAGSFVLRVEGALCPVELPIHRSPSLTGADVGGPSPFLGCVTGARSLDVDLAPEAMREPLTLVVSHGHATGRERVVALDAAGGAVPLEVVPVAPGSLLQVRRLLASPGTPVTLRILDPQQLEVLDLY